MFLEMALLGRNVFGTFEKRAPDLKKYSFVFIPTRVGSPPNSQTGKTAIS